MRRSRLALAGAVLLVAGCRTILPAALPLERDDPRADALLVRAIRRAHRAGLRVIVFPILTLRRTRPGEWRGTLAPTSWDDWWRSYDAFIGHYAAIAARENAAAFVLSVPSGCTNSARSGAASGDSSSRS